MPQTFDYMGALRAGYSVKEIQQATKDIDIHNALEQWGRKFFQKQAKQREAVNSMVRASRNRASAGLSFRMSALWPRKVISDITNSSRIESIGGFVICAKSCLKYQ